MNILSEYRAHLLEKRPQEPRVQYFWLAISAGIIGYTVWNLPGTTEYRAVALIIIALSIATDAMTNISYFKNKRLFERLVNVKITANITSLVVIVAYVVLWYRFKL
jgi:hypothetical protein